MSKKYITRFVIEVVVEESPLEWDDLHDIALGAEHELYQVVDETVTEISGDALSEWIKQHSLEHNYYIRQDTK